jgi:GDPmannose 4,6-dehydratase
MNKNVIVTGVTGQVGSYMAEYLLKNTYYEIYGAIRRLSVQNHQNIEQIKNNKRFHLVEMDLSDSESIESLIREVNPDYFISLAANSFVGTSWKMPVNHFQNNALAVLHQLESIRKHCPTCRYYNAGSSEEFGDVEYCPQDEKHPLNPRSPYGASKAAARHIVKVWRESYGLYAVQGYLFNQESERRGAEFVTRKVTLGVAEIRESIRTGSPFKPINLGNLSSKRDWSHARDFVDGIWRMLNQEVYNPDLADKFSVMSHLSEEEKVKFLSESVQEYVLSSNETHSIREFVEKAFNDAGISGVWIGEGLDERFILEDEHIDLVVVNKEFYRPAEVDLLLGNSNKAREELKWAPKYNFNELVLEMVSSDLARKRHDGPRKIQ